MKYSPFKTIACLIALMLTVLSGAEPTFAEKPALSKEPGERQIQILFTSDIHSHLPETKEKIDGEDHLRGGMARLATLIDNYKDSSTIVIDGGDFAMGTLFQAGYTTDAYELRALGRAGIDITTFGNHEWDFGGYGVAKMLYSAKRCEKDTPGAKLPLIVQSNIDFSGELSDEQKAVKSAFDDYGVLPYTIVERGGVKIALFGLMGIDCIKDSPTSGMKYINYIEAAKKTVAEIGDKAEVIICLSHTGMKGDKSEGEDLDLAKAVPEIDVILSGHSHNVFKEPIITKSAVIVSPGCYLDYLGRLVLTVNEDGTVNVKEHELIFLDDSFEMQEDMAIFLEEAESEISNGYLAKYTDAIGFNAPVAYAPFDFKSTGEMRAEYDEMPMGNLIADSYIYEAEQNGIDDIDVALCALGTIRGAFKKGTITVADAFEICSLGAGGDGSAGHPLVAAYITGKELKLLAELDASMGPAVNSLKMSYSGAPGLRCEINSKRALLDKMTKCVLVKKRPDGSPITEEIEDDKLYKVCCNMYAANMLGMVNGLTKGILKITPKDANGNPVENFYDFTLKAKDGREIKEWVAFTNYLESFPTGGPMGLPSIPKEYENKLGRKVIVEEGGLAALKNPGPSTGIAVAAPLLILALVVILVRKALKRRMKRKSAKKAPEK